LTISFADILYVNQSISNAGLGNQTLGSQTHVKGTVARAPTFEDVLIGDLLIIGSQFLVACQIIFEEYIFAKYHVPVLHAIGLEVIFAPI